MSDDLTQLEERLEHFEANHEAITSVEAERLIHQIIEPLLRIEAYELTAFGNAPAHAFDFIARRPGTDEHKQDVIGIELKHNPSRTPVSLSSVRELLGAALLSGLDRVMLVGSTRFTNQARAAIARDLPVTVELVDLNTLREWIRSSRKSRESPPTCSVIEDLIRQVSRQFATLVAQDPTALDHLEWRDMERMLAAIFEALGFKTTLTPASRDGGKDIVLECLVEGATHSYIVEVKHWRSSTRVGSSAVCSFLEVISRERRQGGLFLSTYGYCDNAFSVLSEIERSRLRFGAKTKVVGLCKTYTKAASGIWSPPGPLVEILYEGTE